MVYLHLRKLKLLRTSLYHELLLRILWFGPIQMMVDKIVSLVTGFLRRKQNSSLYHGNVQAMINKSGKGFGLCKCHKKWRTCRNALPTKEKLARRTIIDDPKCERYLAHSENPLNALWSCMELDIVWADTELRGFRSSSAFQNFKEALSWILDHTKSPALFAITVWVVWSQRNSVHLYKPALALH